MFGGGSIQFARVFGIRIGVDPSWFFVLFLIIWSLSGYYQDEGDFSNSTAFVLAAASALLFFLSVLLHEFGHAFEARRSGIGITGIDLWMFGGVAKMERDSKNAGEEFRVAIAGPVVTLLIAVLCWAVCAAALGTDAASKAVSLNADSIPDDAALAVVGYLGFVNVALLLFNLIPGFPLDGGRVARAIAWKVTGSRTRATRFAGTLGRGFAFLMIGVGIFFAVQGLLVTGIWLGIIGVFLNQAARGAIAQTELTSRIEGLSVADVMDAEPVAIPAELDLNRAYDEFFLRYGWPWFPVVEADGRLVGLVTEQSISSLPEAVRPGRTVASVMANDTVGGDSSLRVDATEPLEALLGREGLVRLGALMAVDADGHLRGIVTADRVRRALQPAPGR
ncbi:MAG TPA: site-2 protease family protein [Thermoleophilaceae bacterium]|nr:site-2 protease family protein [Thermoleophilaceae bacterium]